MKMIHQSLMQIVVALTVFVLWWNSAHAGPRGTWTQSDWTWVHRPEPHTEHRALMTHFKHSSPATEVLKQEERNLAESAGIVGYSVRSNPLTSELWTLSVWRPDAEIDLYARAPDANSPDLKDFELESWGVQGLRGEEQGWVAVLEQQPH